MIRHTQQPQPQQRIRTTSSFRSHLTEVRAYISRRRAWLFCIGLVCCAITVCGILFTVHLYYVEDGGSGWIKRSAVVNRDRTVFLPMRKIERSGLTERSPGILPYFECGDQLQSCQAFNQPDICCPIGTTCYPAEFTLSKIICCRSSSTTYCDYSVSEPPKCLNGTTQCSANTGGGCCPLDTICSPNGCIQTLGPSTVSTKETPASTVLGSIVPGSSSIPPNQAGALTASPVTKTITEAPAATITNFKEGEVATPNVAKKISVFYTLCLPYMTAWILVCVAAVMGML